MSTWQQRTLPGSGRFSVDQLNSSFSFRDSYQLSKKYPSTRELQDELETCKEQLGQLEVRAVAAEAEVTSLGFQKVTMEQEISKCKEEIKMLNHQLESEKEKFRKLSEEVLQKIAHLKDVMELRKSEREARNSLEGIQAYVQQLKSGEISQKTFLSQVETLFACINNKKAVPKNGKLFKSAQSFTENVRATMPPLQSSFLKEADTLFSQDPIEEEEPTPSATSLSPELSQYTSPSPPPIPPRGIEQPDLSLPSQIKKPVPSPRKLVSKTTSSPGGFGEASRTDPPKKMPRFRRRLSSRVDSLYSLAPPPGTPAQPKPPIGAIACEQRSLEWSTESEDSDFEPFTPPSIPKQSSSEFNGPRSESPLASYSLVKNVRSASTKETPSHALANVSLPKKQNSLSNLEPVTSWDSPKTEEGEEFQAIKKSSPIMTKRPVWLSRESFTSRSSSELEEKKLKRRSRSMDAMLVRSVSSPVDQCRGQPVALSDCEESDFTGGSGYSKPFQHIRQIQQLLSVRKTASISESMDKLYRDSNWNRYDDDSADEEIYYIDPKDVEARKGLSSKAFQDSPGLRDNTYLMLSNPQLDSSPQRRVGISIHSPSPIPGHMASPIPNLASSSRGLSPELTPRNGFTSDATTESGNELDSEDNIYENPDASRESPLFDNQMYLENRIPDHQNDIYAQIDEVRGNFLPTFTSGVASSESSHGQTVDHLSQAFVPFSKEDMQNEDGYARVHDIRVPVQAPSLPPRPPNFMRVARSGNPARTVPGIGSLPRYTTLGGSEHQVQLVPLDQTSSWRQTESRDDFPVASSLPSSFYTQPPPDSRRPKKSLVHMTARPNLRGMSSQLDNRPSSEMPSNNSAFQTPSPSPPAAGGSPTLKASSVQQRSSSLPANVLNKSKKISCLSSSPPVLLEKSGFLLFQDQKQKSPKKRWVVLTGTELKLYQSSKDRKKPRVVINLDKCCKSSTKNGKEIQLDMSDKVYHLVAADKTECEAWLRVIEAAMQGVNETSDSSDEAPPTTSLSGWARVDGLSKTVWCSLEGHTLLLALEPGAEPIRQLNMEQCAVKLKRDSILMDHSRTDLKVMVLNIRNKETRNVTILHPIKTDLIEEWYYVLNSLHYGEEGPELTRTEQFLSEIMKDNPIRHLDHPRWGNPVFKVAPMPIHNSLISMPTVELKELAKSLFRDLQRFINKKIDSSSMEFHIPLAQKIIGQCLTHSKLQDEIYCQLLRQMSGHTVPTAAPVLQGWLLLFLLLPMYLPSRKIISWYLTIFLERSVISKNPVICELAKNCQSIVKQCVCSGSRQCTPTYFELKGLFEEFIATPLAPPTGAVKTGVYLSDGSMHEVVFFATTTVTELVSQLTDQVGLPDSASTGFALMCDWPGVTDEVLCCPFLESKVCDVISMWTLSMEELNQHTQVLNLEQRNITFTYKRRLAFGKRQGSESNYECVLLAHQINKDLSTGLSPTSSKQAIQLAAMMAQLEYGDLESLQSGERERVGREAVERFCPWSLTFMALEHDWLRLQSELMCSWRELAGKSRDECARLYLNTAQTWSMCGATMFKAEQRASVTGSPQSAHVWLAIHESGVSLLNQKSMEMIKSYTYNDISTFGGHGEDDFMLMVTPKDAPTEATTERLLFSMDKIQICEATFLMATYIECLKKLNDTE